MRLETGLSYLEVGSVLRARVTRAYIARCSRISAGRVRLRSLRGGAAGLLTTAVRPSRRDHVDLSTEWLTVLLTLPHLPLVTVLRD